MQSKPGALEQTLTLDPGASRPEARVLIVDDGLQARDSVVAVVEQAGYEATVVSNREEALQLLERDALTGAYSRLYLERQLSLELERTRRFGHPLSVLLVDIDHFQRINDRHGHAAGDEVLAKTYQRLRELLPRACDWIGRYGGEKFLIVLIDTDLHGAEIVAQRLVGGIAESVIETSAGQVPVTISVGGAEAAQMLSSELDFKGLLEIAEQCLYASKHEGRNRFTLWHNGGPHTAASIAAGAIGHGNA